MKKFATLLLLATLAVTAANAQRKATVSGVVADADTREILIGAVVAMASTSDSTLVTTLVSGAGGAFSTGLAQGEYTFSVSLLGYETLREAVSVTAQKVSVDTLYLSRGIRIDDVVKTAVAMRTSLAGDTIIYNADSYKVAADADVSGILSKMPGIKVENGSVEAQGETVKKILIDGREFFGEDVNAAITALPAEVVKSIEVFDKLSDNAEFTGIDDGEGYKAINIRTRESMRQGVMGQVSGLVGVEPAEAGETKTNLYGSAKGNVSIFQGDAKITLGGTLNNLNQRNFTADDFMGFGGGNGLGTVGVLQANYIDTWGKKNQWEVDATYRFNSTDSENTEERETEFFDKTLPYPFQYSLNQSNRANNNHVFRARIDFKPNKYQELRLRPFLRYQGNSSGSNGWDWYSPVDDITSADAINYENWSNSRGTGLRAGMDANYRVRLGKPGRTLTTRLNVGYNKDDRFGENFSQNLVGSEIVSLRRKTPSDNYGYNLQGGVIYTEPVSTSSLITLDYNFSYQYSDIDRKRYDWDDVLKGYLPTYNEIGSGIYNSNYWTHRVGPGYRMQKGETTVSAGVFFQYSTLSSESVAPKMAPLKSSYYNPTYSVMITSKFGQGASLRLFLNSNTNPPSVGNLQDVVNLASEQNISIGDPALKPAYNHQLFARFILPNVQKGRTFSLNFFGNYAQNYVSNMVLRNAAGYQITNSEGEYQYTLSSPTQTFTKPVNLDGFWSVRGGADYGFPLTFLKSNLNLRVGASYAETPSLTGAWNGTTLTTTKNNSRNVGVNGGLGLGSNISEKVDFMISYNVSYNNVRNSTLTLGNNSYLRHMVMGNFKFVLPANFTISGDAFYTNYNALTGGAFDEQYVLLNASVGKKIFRDRSGEISLFCNDIANQNTSFQRQWNADNMANVTNSVIGRYFGVKLTWNIRLFGKNGSHNIDMYQSPGGGGFGGPGFRGGPPRF
ncbi:MAG: outer membrane beta-barrel protein [Rikenellaceae bacterium]|jgi:uncharacterized membrane protein|nr:outer membrane beta-barrel protein [Rikenellaceae bacterium]